MDVLVRCNVSTGGFVDVPCSMLKRASLSARSVRVLHDCDTRDGIVLNATLLHRKDGASVYSCGGLLARLEESEDEVVREGRLLVTG